MPPATGMTLRMASRTPPSAPVLSRSSRRGLDREVVVVGRHVDRLDQPVGLDVHGHGDVVGVVDGDRPDLVVHVERLVDGRERVVAVVADRPDPQGQVDLRGDPRGR